MQRYLAVQIHHPRLSHAAIFRLDKPHRRSRRLVTLSENQRAANVEIRLLEGRRRDSLEVTRSLHTFYLKDLPREPGERTEILLEAEYDGAGSATFAVFVGGEKRSTVTLEVPRERRLAPWLLAGAAVLLLGLGTILILPRQSENLAGEAADSPESAPLARTQRSPAPADRGETSTGAERSAEVGEPREEEPPAPAAETDSSPEEALEVEEVDSTPPPENEPPPLREFLVYFRPDDTRLTAAAQRRLEEVAATLSEAGASTPVRIVGHTALFGTEEGRFEISRGRAENVYSYLRSLGWEPEREPTIAWEGSTDPVTRARDEQELNRRVEVEIGEQER